MKESGDLNIQWRTVATGSFVVALAALVVLAVVSTVRNADTLSVVALALAILAFVIQIIVFVVQSAIATRQEVQFTEIYGRTLGALAAIEEKSEGTRRDVSTMNEKLIDAAIGKAIPEAQADESLDQSPIEFADDVSRRVRELVRSAADRREESEAPDRSGRTNPLRLDASMFWMPVDDALVKALETLDHLDEVALVAIQLLGLDQKSTGGSTTGLGLAYINPSAATALAQVISR